MNIDAWLSGGEGARVVECMAAAMFATVSRQPWGRLHQYDKSDYQKYATAGLRAALSLTTTEPCPACGGAGCAGSFAAPESTRQWTPRPDCKGGTVPGESVLVPRHQRDLLADVLGRLLVALGAVTDSPMTGPELLMHAEGAVEHFGRLHPLEKEDET